MNDSNTRSVRPDRDPGLAGRSFVLQLSVESGSQAGSFAGRVQHLETLDGGNFDSADALVAIIRRVLGRTQRDEEQAT